MDLNMQSASDVISSLFWFRDPDDVDEDEEEQDSFEQFVQNVEDFSSQYGSEISVSYTAFNIRGPPSNFPDYGDYPQAFVMRTYGTWWEEAPSAPEDYMPQNNLAIPSQDFVEVSFARAVIPQEVSVFETYNPGAVVRIWARCGTDWLLLWEGEEECGGETPRIFSPPIKQIDVPTKILRLEFNHRNLPYYTELDAVLLKGKELPPLNTRSRNNLTYTSLFYKKTTPAAEPSDLMSRILASNLHESLGPPTAPEEELNVGPPQGDFTPLPDETILCVMKYLDLKSLCRCARVNKHFNRLASDPILYRSVDLRPYWHCVDSQVIWTLSTRCRYLQKLDLSWCGSGNMVDAKSVVHFLRDTGCELTHLRLNCCRFVDSSVLRAIVLEAPCLQELCLRSISGTLEWSCLAGLNKLERLDLYRADITTAAAVAVVRANPRLRHVNFGSCKQICSMDEVAVALGACCPGLRSVDFWKSYSLSALGLRALQACAQLQELDVGWCLQAGSSGEWLAWLQSRQLRKLFLGALRGVSDRDLRVVLPRLTRLEQLDFLGVRTITPDICEAILAECNHLRLLDVSFCDQIHESRVNEWRAKYPQVSIKRSYQSTSYLSASPNQLFLAPSLE